MKFKNQSLSCTGHIPNSQKPYVASGQYIGQLRNRICSLLQKVLSNGAISEHPYSTSFVLVLKLRFQCFYFNFKLERNVS